MRTLNISGGGLKLEANFDLKVGESMDLVILVDGTRIRCRGRIIAIEEHNHRVHARLRFISTEYRKLSHYLDKLSQTPFQKWIIVGVFIVLAYIAYLIIRTYLLQ